MMLVAMPTATPPNIDNITILIPLSALENIKYNIPNQIMIALELPISTKNRCLSDRDNYLWFMVVPGMGMNAEQSIIFLFLVMPHAM